MGFAEMPTSAFAGANRSMVPGVEDLYLNGVYSYEQRTPSALTVSLQNFNEAIAKDPNYAPAYAGLAITYNLSREYSGMSPAEAYPKAETEAEHAIALDPKLPQAHAALGFVNFFWHWKPESGEAEFKTALSLDPNLVLAHHWYGSQLFHQGRYDEALAQLDVAQHLQPTSAAIVSLRALAFGFNGHRDDAVAKLDGVMKEVPSATSPHNALAALSLVAPRDIPRYLAETRRVAELRHDQQWIQFNNAADRAYRAGGEKAMWAGMIEFDKHRHSDVGVAPYTLAEAHAALGQKEEAIAILEKLVAEHNPITMGLYNDPMFVDLHQDPRFKRLAEDVGCPLPVSRE
jgi:tetratricopeptide (TPR) repeat protein